MTGLLILLIIAALGMLVYWVYIQVSNLINSISNVVNTPWWGIF